MSSAETLIKIADFLDVSIDFLLDRTDNTIVNSSTKNLSKDEELLNIFHQLTNEQKEDIILYTKIRKQM